MRINESLEVGDTFLIGEPVMNQEVGIWRVSGSYIITYEGRAQQFFSYVNYTPGRGDGDPVFLREVHKVLKEDLLRHVEEWLQNRMET